jgi:hypothetical protein
MNNERTTESLEAHGASRLFFVREGMKMLPSERNTKAMERKVRSAAAQRFGRGKTRPFFEHGHWWIEVPDFYDPSYDAIYSVVDAEPGIGETGLDFEPVFRFRIW